MRASFFPAQPTTASKQLRRSNKRGICVNKNVQAGEIDCCHFHDRCTILYGTPTMLVDILNLPTLKQHDTSSWSMVLVGGAPCPLELAKSINKELNVKHIMVKWNWESKEGAFSDFQNRF